MKKLIIVAGLVGVGIFLMTNKKSDKSNTGTSPSSGGSTPGNTATNPIVPAGSVTAPGNNNSTTPASPTPIAGTNNTAALKIGDPVLYNNLRWTIKSISGDTARLERGSGITAMKVSAKLMELFKL
ncbi:hypothetical protein [Flavobacterium sp.]|uniref:hypothetical protein n=1 Tax=Flavobacterium sp. TaxID=239 RepID=UPI0040340830